jgi:BirA family biotin operon repressor/biotin-[acetyl-CoA-carboxylase] ligase
MTSLIYLDHCTSTNDEIIDFINTRYLEEDFLTVYTFNQTHGRGQYGNTWENSPQENLAFSFAIKNKNFSTSPILLNYYTAIIIRDFIANLTQTEVKIKWPNDIILKNKKICGMLFEKKGDYLITGIGINILQKNFEGLPKGGSLFTQTGLKFDLKTLAESLHHYILGKLIQNEIPEDILETYNTHLFKRHEVSVFEKDHSRQNGIIQSADESGNLWIELENEGLQKFFHKEIELLY